MTRKSWLQSLITRSKLIWGARKYERKQWLKQTIYLYDCNGHILQTGKFRYHRYL